MRFILTQPYLRFPRSLTVSAPCLALAALLFGVLVPRTASAVQGAELYRTQAYFYGRFEARVRHAPGEGVVSSFFLWKDGSSSTTTWNELDFEKINSTCHLQTNIWTGQGTQSTELDTPSFNICSDYHTYAFEWTPDYIAWFIDGSQVRKVTGASVTEYTKNASAGMAMHFNIWQGDSTFGGTLNTSTLPVYEYISWAQYSSYANGAFQLQWREEFTGSTTPTNWALGNWAAPLGHSTHNVANAQFVNGIAVLALTNDNATGYTGTPPVDPAASTTGTGGTSGSGGSGSGGSGTGGSGTGGSGTGGSGSGGSGRGGSGGTTGSGGSVGTGGSASSGSGGTSSTGTGGTGVSGTGGSGAGGVSAGNGGSGAGGDSAGTGGSGTGGTPGSGGTSDTGSGGTASSGGSTGTAGTAGESPGSSGGCGCRTAVNGSNGGGALLSALLIAACALRRRHRNPARL